MEEEQMQMGRTIMVIMEKWEMMVWVGSGCLPKAHVHVFAFTSSSETNYPKFHEQKQNTHTPSLCLCVCLWRFGFDFVCYISFGGDLTFWVWEKGTSVRWYRKATDRTKTSKNLCALSSSSSVRFNIHLCLLWARGSCPLITARPTLPLSLLILRVRFFFLFFENALKPKKNERNQPFSCSCIIIAYCTHQLW